MFKEFVRVDILFKRLNYLNKKFTQLLYESLMLNLLYGSYDIKQVASEPITTKVFRNELPFETIPALEPEEAILWFFEK